MSLPSNWMTCGDKGMPLQQRRGQFRRDSEPLVLKKFDAWRQGLRRSEIFRQYPNRLDHDVVMWGNEANVGNTTCKHYFGRDFFSPFLCLNQGWFGIQTAFICWVDIVLVKREKPQGATGKSCVVGYIHNMFVFMYAWIYMYMYIHLKCIWICTCICLSIYMCICICTVRTCKETMNTTHTHAHIWSYVYIYIYTHTFYLFNTII